ncbi:MAG: hypothetical protein ACREXX_21440 [Gammaproteobacteria bacterium]
MRADAQHIALATVARVDVLVSWNFKHMVNLKRIHAYNSVNLKMGYPLLEIRTPREVQAMSESSPKAFDCVQSMRQARDSLSAQIADMSYDDLVSGPTGTRIRFFSACAPADAQKAARR